MVDRPEDSRGSPSSSGARRGLLPALILIVAALLAFWLWPKRIPEPDPPSLVVPLVDSGAGPIGTPQGANTSAIATTPSWSAHHPSPPDPTPVLPPRTLWEKRLARSNEVLNNYLENTKYPEGSQPAGKSPGMSKPLGLNTVTRIPLRRKDGKTTKAKLSLFQDRVYVSGDEAVLLRLSAADENGPIALTVKAARAQVPSITPDPKPAAVPITFADDGTGVLTASFQPARNGFASYRGDIEIIADLLAGPEDGDCNWAVVFTPGIPAKFNGKIREVSEEGSLSLYVGVDVVLAGHYIITARADSSPDLTPLPPRIAAAAEQLKNSDFRVRVSASIALGASADAAAVRPLCECFHNKAEVDSVLASCQSALLKLMDVGGRTCLNAPPGGSPDWLALLTFNGNLDKGEQEAKLVIFGKMVRDAKGVSPFKLRDMDGFLLYPASSPDRDLMTSKMGVFHTTKSYPIESFSDATYMSDEKKKYIDEYSKDVAIAKKHVEDEASGKVPEEKLPEEPKP